MKKETQWQVLSCEFCEIFKNTFFTEQLRMSASAVCEDLCYNLTFWKRSIFSSSSKVVVVRILCQCFDDLSLFDYFLKNSVGNFYTLFITFLETEKRR